MFILEDCRLKIVHRLCGCLLTILNAEIIKKIINTQVKSRIKRRKK